MTNSTLTDEQQAALENLKRLFQDSMQQLKAASKRFDKCIDSAAVWRSWLNEHGYTRQLEQVSSQEKRDALVSAQRERRFYYTGWRLASLMAISDLEVAAYAYSRIQRELEKADRSLVAEKNYLEWLLSCGADDDGRINAYSQFSGGGKLYALVKDESQGRGPDAVDELYAECLAGKRWSGRYNVFGLDDCQPLTFVAWQDCSDEMVGCHLLPVLDDLLHRQGTRGADRWFTIMEDLTAHGSQRNEPQQQARVGRLGSTHEEYVKKETLEIQFKMQNALYLHRITETQRYVSDVRRFRAQLAAFVDLHRVQPLTDHARCEMGRYYAAKFNCVAAWALMASIDTLVENWQRILEEKHLPILAAFKSFPKDWRTALAADLTGLVSQMRYALNDSYDYLSRMYDPIGRAAREHLADRLEKIETPSGEPFDTMLVRLMPNE